MGHKVFAAHIWGPVFDIQHPPKNPGIMMCANLSTDILPGQWAFPYQGFLGPSDERACYKAWWTAPEDWYLVLISDTHVCTNPPAHKKHILAHTENLRNFFITPKVMTLLWNLFSLCVWAIGKHWFYLRSYRFDLSFIDLPTMCALCVTFPREG